MTPQVAFSGTIAPARISAAYRLGLVVIAATMLLLPILYLGLIAIAGAAVWWHITANTSRWRTPLFRPRSVARRNPFIPSKSTPLPWHTT